MKAIAYASEALMGVAHERKNLRKIQPCEAICVPSPAGSLIKAISFTINAVPTNSARAFTPKTSNGQAHRR